MKGEERSDWRLHVSKSEGRGTAAAEKGERLRRKREKDGGDGGRGTTTAEGGGGLGGRPF